jgi:hypothetical protein
MSIDEFRSHHKVKAGSNRSFGIIFAAFFALIGLWPTIAGHPVRWWGLALSVLFVGAAFVAPQLLQPLNRSWSRFGVVLSGIVNPLLMALIFFLAVMPVALLMRLVGRDLLGLKRQPVAGSYWITRAAPSSMSKQF